MKLFDIIGNKLKIHVDALALPPFQSIWDSEKDKDLAEKYIKFVVFFYKYDSPYVSGYSPEDRERVLKEDIFKDPNYTIPDKVYELGRRYQELQRTPNIRLLEAANEGMEYLIEEYRLLRERRGMTDKLGKPLVTAEQVYKWLEHLDSVSRNIESLKKKVQIEQLETGKVRGGSSIGSFELPNKK